MYNENRTAGSLSSYALRCEENRWGISIAKKKKGQKEEEEEDVNVPRLPIVKPEALEGKGREVAVAADRLGANTHSKQ